MKAHCFILLFGLIGLIQQISAQEDGGCGDPPAEPIIVDGATATMEQLVANSQEVNLYIGEADLFLDCSELRYKRLSSSRVHKAPVAEQIRLITARRNAIQNEFNNQVAAFRVANPQ